VRVRRFVCATSDCVRQTFTEHLPGLTARLRQIGLALGGQAGALLSRQQGIPTRPDTLLRLLRAGVTTPTRAPRVLGIDDWAFKKGHTYGTILGDLETRQSVDLLPDRPADSVAPWLRDHPGGELVCRDRAPAYADGVTRGAPQAIQVAERFHLLQNLSTALSEVFGHEQQAIQTALHPPPAGAPAPPDPPPADSASALAPAPPPRLTRHAARNQQTRARR
jgi:transposase